MMNEVDPGQYPVIQVNQYSISDQYSVKGEIHEWIDSTHKVFVI